MPSTSVSSITRERRLSPATTRVKTTFAEAPMHQTFDKKVPRWQQILRVMQAKIPGWKHGTKRRSWKVKEQAKKLAAHQEIQRKKFKDKVRAYWNGTRDGYPKS